MTTDDCITPEFLHVHYDFMIPSGAAMFGTTLAISLGGIVASRHLHADLLHSILQSPMSFFEVTPSGNLLNRFSKEIDAIDCMIPDGLKMMLGYLFKLLEVCIIVLLATPHAGLVLLPLICLYAFIQVNNEHSDLTATISAHI